MACTKPRHRAIGVYVVMTISIMLCSGTRVFGFQRPYAVPATHERQCVSTGEIPPGDARTITVTWKQPFATGNYDIIGAVSESGDSSQAIELKHIVMPHTPAAAAAVVVNRDAAPQSALLCLDASVE